jgi:hypothetical protein
MKAIRWGLAPLFGGLFAAGATATELTITIENPLGEGNFFFTPVWVAAHDGSFDVFTSGESAGNFDGLEEVAELGDTGPLSDRFSNSAAGTAGGQQATFASVAFGGDAPVYSPGENNTVMFDPGDATVNRYFSFASMVIPTNDLFFANGDPMAYELFNAAGEFQGPLVIEVLGTGVYDAGTELNDATAGAAFSANGGASIDETENISLFFSQAGAPGYLDSFLGSTTGNGATISETFGRDDVIARITIVPEPSSVLLLSLAGIGLLRRR